METAKQGVILAFGNTLRTANFVASRMICSEFDMAKLKGACKGVKVVSDSLTTLKRMMVPSNYLRNKFAKGEGAKELLREGASVLREDAALPKKRRGTNDSDEDMFQHLFTSVRAVGLEMLRDGVSLGDGAEWGRRRRNKSSGTRRRRFGLMGRIKSKVSSFKKRIKSKVSSFKKRCGARTCRLDLACTGRRKECRSTPRHAHSTASCLGRRATWPRSSRAC